MSRRNTYLSLEVKHYDPKNLEREIYALWEENEVFSKQSGSNKPPYTIVIPPPNVTGRLHMGHALNNSVQDALIRFKRMDGFDALWVPGTDHAGISTQSVVKKHLDAEGINYKDLGREKMIERIWKWKEKYGDQILLQLRSLGCSCDWSMSRFTMDEGLSRAVRTAFKRFYDDGLIYRGKYIVNWCPVDHTALSDDEVETAEGGEPGHLWHFRYPLADGSGHVTIATTRPETMLGDTAVAVNPKDERYTDMVGKTILLPLVGREIPIIADDHVDKEFGSGCLKVTPAHDPNDFQIGQRHKLPTINVMNEDASIGDQAPEQYHGLDRFECRTRIVEEMKAAGLLEQIDDRMTPVGRAQRSKAIIEYRLSDQWFVKMKPLAEQALVKSEKGDLTLHPERWEKIYRHWLVNTRDWCISRQIWWGHRIPAWYHKETGEILVDVETPAAVQSNPDVWRQDDDVLDTWFSSALWPFSTLGWPDTSSDLERYYPTSVLSTAKDIIYFWVARMVMTGVHLMGKVPFQQVYFHPVICDARGETMSKSKGNGIDPLHVIEGAKVEDLEGPIYEARPENMEELLGQLHKNHPDGFPAVGADALRFTLLSLNSQAQQVQLSLQKFEDTGKRFIDKLWNASRFVFANLENIPADDGTKAELQLEDRWILSQLDDTTKAVREALEEFNFNQAASVMYRFFWDDFCDWYVELTKGRLKSESAAEIRLVQGTLVTTLSTILRLLHPLVPFVTEELWGHLRNIVAQSDLVDSELTTHDLCARASYPVDHGRADKDLASRFALLQEVVRTVRYMRSNVGIGRNVSLEVHFLPKNAQAKAALNEGSEIIQRGAQLKSIHFCDTAPQGMATAVIDGVEIFANLAEHMDIEAELARNQSALTKVEKEIKKAQSKLGNEKFLQKAPKEVQEKLKDALAESETQREKLLQVLKELSQA